jgi:hypothetical protein
LKIFDDEGREMLTDLVELSSWLINAFNGEWLKIEDAVPKAQIEGRSLER